MKLDVETLAPVMDSRCRGACFNAALNDLSGPRR